MCVVCFTTAQLAAVGAVSARWWYVNRLRPDAPDPHVTSDSQADGEKKAVEPAPVA